MSKVSKASVVSDTIEPYKPTIEINSKQLPAVAKWDVGQDYTVTMKIHMKAKHQGGYGQADNMVSGNFEIVSVSNKPGTKAPVEKESKQEDKGEVDEKTETPKKSVNAAPFMRMAKKY